MSNAEKFEEITVSIDDWVNKAKADPEAFLERQATEIFLTTLGSTEPYCGKFFLKGGLLMGIVYDSPRQTADIDYSTSLEPNLEVAAHLEETIDNALPAVAARLGYTDIVCKIQRIEHRPRASRFTDATAPGFEITVGYAKRGSHQEKRLQNKQAANVLNIDVSFREPVGGIQIVRLGNDGHTLNAYSLQDVVTEKFRALMQQEKRNRYRRQDIYDLSLLLTRFTFDEVEKKEMLGLLVDKCRARDITPNINSIQEEEVVRRARSEWETLELEIGSLPDFDACFDQANSFYRSLPWIETSSS